MSKSKSDITLADIAYPVMLALLVAIVIISIAY
jgi:hypothetical protein